MFGMGGTEILVILIVALLFLGPDKLPEAAKQISKGIRDIKKQSRALQRTIEDDEHIGGAIRDLKSALRGEDEPIRPIKQLGEAHAGAITAAAATVPAADTETAADPLGTAAATGALAAGAPYALGPDGALGEPPASTGEPPASTGEPPASTGEPPAAATTAVSPRLTLPATAGEADDDHPSAAEDAAELAAMVKPAANTIARGAAPGAPSDEPPHG